MNERLKTWFGKYTGAFRGAHRGYATASSFEGRAGAAKEVGA